MTGVGLGAIVASPPTGASGFTWSIVPSPNTSGQTNYNELNAVSCTGPSACVAVGLYFMYESGLPGRTAYQTLIESWNGSAWSIVPSPNTSPTQDNVLSAVSCSGPSACVAVGFFTTPGVLGTPQTLIESWNGSAWSIVPSPNTSSTQGNLLGGVSCTGPSACVAVGNGGSTGTLIESWNGSAWSIVPSPNTSPTQVNVLQAVSCSGPSACVAVGQYYVSGDFSQTLIESWNGSAWSIVPSPNTSPTQINLLGGVSCSSPSACTAVGNYEASISTAQQTLIESWNGSAWSIVPSPNSSPTQNNGLSGVSCSRPSACTAVGFYSTASTQQTLIESWNGSAWSIVASPNASQTNLLLGVSCSSSSACTAVGYSNNQTLIERGTLSTTTSVLIPSGGAALSGTRAILDALATASAGVATVQFVLTGGSYNQTVIGTAVPTLYGYILVWNTTGVPGGTYTLQSLVTDEDGNTAYSAGVTITVDNTPPTTVVLVPSNGAVLKGIAVLDASASASFGVQITKVQFVLTGRSYNKSVIGTASPTIFGWVFVANSTLVHNGKYILQSLATDAAGNTAYSPGISIIVAN